MTNFNRTPPHAIDAEKAVIGAMLIDSCAIDAVVEVVGGDGASTFYHRPHALIYGAILAIHDRDSAVDQLTVGEELKRCQHLEEAGGVIYLAELSGGVASGANAAHHARLILEHGQTRLLIEAASKATSQAYDNTHDVRVIADSLSSALYEIVDRHKSGGFVSAQDGLPQVFEEIERLHQSHDALPGLDTGIVALNEKTGGWQSGDLIIEAARPSIGKTSLALTHAVHLATKCGIGVGVFSLEMPTQQVLQRVLSMITGVSLHKMRMGELGDEDWQQLNQNMGRLVNSPLFIDDTTGLTVLEMRAKARQLVRRHGVKMVVVDYLGLMEADEKTQSREQEISKISRGLKAMAKELNIPVIALSQLSRASESRTDKRGQLSDLRDSGSLEQDADIVLFIYRPEAYGLKGKNSEDTEGLAELNIAKHRNGPTGVVYAQFEKRTPQFCNLEQDHWIRRTGDMNKPR